MKKTVSRLKARSPIEETAGRLMSRELVAVPEHMSVGDLGIDFLRDGRDLQDFFEVFVVDERHHPVSTCQLSWILRTRWRRPRRRDGARPDADPRHARPGRGREHVPEYALHQRRRGGRGRAAGRPDDGGRRGPHHRRRSGRGRASHVRHERWRHQRAHPRRLFRPRALARRQSGHGLLAGFIIALFGAAIEQLVALAVLMPIVASIGENTGTQTMAVTVRAIAMNQLTRSSTRRCWRELRVAMLNGATIAVLIGLATGAFATPLLGGVIAAAMVVNVLVPQVGGRPRPGHLRPAGSGPGRRVERVRDDDHRFHGLLRVSGPRGREVGW